MPDDIVPQAKAKLTADNVLFYSIVAAVVPVLLYTALIYWVDRYEKEPWWLLSAAFIWGAIPAAILSLLFNMLFSLPFFFVLPESSAELAAGGVVAPVVEELAKALVLFLILLVQHHELDSPLDGIIYGAMVGMGFAMVENILYYTAEFGASGQAGWNTLIVVRGILFGLNHSLFSAITGLGIALARMSNNWLVRIGAPLMGLAVAILLHAIHNFSMFAGSPGAFLFGLVFDWGGVVMTVGIIGLALIQERAWMKEYLREEVALGTLSDEEYQLVSSAARRNRYRTGLLLSQGLSAYRLSGRRYRHCSELAYRKRHHSHFNDVASLQAIDRLRKSIADSASGLDRGSEVKGI